MLNGYIMLKDQPVARFQGNGVTPLDAARVPLCFRQGGDLESWLVSRAIDRHRTNSRILKKLLRLSDTSDRNTVLRVHGASLTDCYWVKMDGEELSWAAVRFSENYFGDVALKGTLDSFAREFTPAQLRSNTPELTNIGSYEKCWKLREGRWVMYKRGTPEERFSEIFTARLGQLLGFSMAEYWEEEGCSCTWDFTRGIWNYEPMSNLVLDEEDYAYNYRALTNLPVAQPEKLTRQYLDILFLDALVFNPDRHTMNYGLLRDQDTGEILSMAPNFDNNMALIARGYASDLTKVVNPLIQYFKEFLQEQGVTYPVPPLERQAVTQLAQSVMPEAQIDRDYVTEFVMGQYERLAQ